MPIDDGGEFLLEQQRHALRVIEEARLQHHIEHGVGRRDGQRIAAEGRAVRARCHTGRGFGRRQTSPDRKAAAERLGQRHDVGFDADALMGEQATRAAHARLDLVEDEQNAFVVAQLAQRPEEGMRRRADAALTLQRLDQDAGGGRTDGFFHGFDVAERDLIEAVERRAEAFEIFRSTRRGQCRQRATMKRALKSDDAEFLRMALGRMVATRDLDRTLHRFSAGIAEEHRVRKAVLAQPCGKAFTVRALEQVRHVPKLGRLLLQSRHQMRMRMAERIHRDARCEIEIALAVGPVEPDAFAALERQIGTGEHRHQMGLRRGWGLGCARGHGTVRSILSVVPYGAASSREQANSTPETKRAALFGRH